MHADGGSGSATDTTTITADTYEKGNRLSNASDAILARIAANKNGAG